VKQELVLDAWWVVGSGPVTEGGEKQPVRDLDSLVLPCAACLVLQLSGTTPMQDCSCSNGGEWCPEYLTRQPRSPRVYFIVDGG
jgi:hypothetical protein